MTDKHDSAGEQGGFRCPECGGHVPTTVRGLLERGSFRCQSCGLELSVDSEKSEEALALLADYQARTR